MGLFLSLEQKGASHCYKIVLIKIVRIVLFHLYPPVTKNDYILLYFGRIRTRLGVVHFQVFRLFL